MKNKTAVHLYWATIIYRQFVDILITRPHIHLSQYLSKGNVQGAIDYNTHSAVFIVRADVGDGVIEIWVYQSRHRDQELVCQIRRSHTLMISTCIKKNHSFANGQRDKLLQVEESALFARLSESTFFQKLPGTNNVQDICFPVKGIWKG